MDKTVAGVVLCGVLLAGGLAGPVAAQTPAAAEEAPPKDAPTTTAPAIPGSGRSPSEMSPEEMVLEAYQLIEHAEEGGADAKDYIARVNEMVTSIRLRNPIDADADFLDGRVQLLMGRPREAIGLISRYSSSRKGENDWLAFKLLGDLYSQAKYYSMARDKYYKAIELKRDESEAHAGLAQAELAMSRPHVAAKAARKAVELESIKPAEEQDARIYAVLTQALLGERKPEEADAVIKQAIELAEAKVKRDPTNAQLLGQLDAFYGMEEKVVQAILISYTERTQEYVRLVRIRKQRVEISYLNGLHSVLNQIDQYIEQTAPDVPPSLYLEKARLLLAVGDEGGGVAVLRDLVGRDPSNAEARALLDNLQAAAASGDVIP